MAKATEAREVGQERAHFEDQLNEWRQDLLRALLRIGSVVGLIAFAVCLWQIALGRLHWINALVASVMVVMVVGASLAPRHWQGSRVAILAFVFYAAGALGSLGGIVSLYGAGFVGFVAIASLFAGRTGGIVAISVMVIHTGIISLAFERQWVTSLIPSVGLDPAHPANWMRAMAFVLTVSVILAACITSLLKRLQMNLIASLELVDRLEHEKNQREDMKEQILRSQRMEALGRLAGGIAHDFNNALTVMGGEADYIVSEVGEEHPIGESAEIIRLATERAATLTRRLLLFGRQKEFLRPSPVDLFAVLNEFMRISRRVLPESIELAFDKCEPVTVEVDASALHQALLNLAINAGDAMDQSGRITLACGIKELAQGETTLSPGSYGFITVRDTGKGIAKEFLGEIFDPFFTTEEGKKFGSSGMGLASSFGFATASNGTIEVESEVGVGTVFSLYFPISDKKVRETAAHLGSVAGMGKGQLALIAEDNLRVRAFMWSALSDAGYEVLEAADGEAAHKLAAKCERPIAVLVTDYMMPKMDGVTLAERVHEAHPDVKIVLVTGYATSGAGDKLREIPNTILLPKPFGRRDLFRALQSMQ